MDATNAITATAFKATCLDPLDGIQTGKVSWDEVTQRGRVLEPAGAYLTAPMLDEPFMAQASAMRR